MDYLCSVMPSLLVTTFFVFLIATIGYFVGGISIKGISLGTAGVLLVALVFGIISAYVPFFSIGGNHFVLYLPQAVTLEDGTVLAATKSAFSLVSNLGTAMFVTAVGLIAGPKFFRTFNKKSLGYILMGVIIILVGALVAIVILLVSRDENLDSSLITGLLTGALTSTPGLSAAKEAALDEAKVTAGYGIAYIFGVLGVVFFVQLMPRFMKVDIEKERENFIAAGNIEVKFTDRKLRKVDPMGFCTFSLTIALGYIIGCLKVPGTNFSLGASGGVLLAGLIVGHFGHIGGIDLRVKKETLNFFRELGLCLFLVGCGVPGGVNFVSNVKFTYFLDGILLTVIPMVVGYCLGRYVFKLSIFNNLGAITGGMTSTPALGALISTAGTDEVAAAYATTYPVALVMVVLVAKIIVMVF